MPQIPNSEGITRYGIPMNALVVNGANLDTLYVAFQDKDGLTVGEDSVTLDGNDQRVVDISGMNVPASAAWMVIRCDADVAYNFSGAELSAGQPPYAPASWVDKTPITPAAMILAEGEMLAVGVGANGAL